MISVERFCESLKNRNITFLSGVPCSILKKIINYALNDSQITYVPAPREDSALGVASGAYMCGRASGILIQNSGLGNIVDSLTSFNLIYKVPVLMIISWRGYLGKDAPEHSVMGEKTLDLLEELGISYGVLEEDNLDHLIDVIVSSMNKQKIPGAIVLRRGIVE